MAFLVFLVVVAGCLIWLRSSAGAGFVYNKLVSVLADNGFTLTASTFEGPLPGRLLMRDAAVSDAEGPLVRVGLAEVEVSLWSLLRGLVHVPILKVEDPEVIRIPALEGQDDKEESSGSFALPVDIRLDRLALTGGLVRAGALEALGLDSPELALSAEGRASLEGERSELDFQARLAEADGREVLNLLLKLEGDAGGPAPVQDRLTVSLKVDDRPGGLLSRLMADPDWAGLNLDFEGQGPLKDWAGQLKFKAEAWGQAELDLTLAGGSGNLVRDLSRGRDLSAGLSAKLRPGDGLSEEALRLIGEEVELKISGELKKSDLKVDLKMNSAGEPPVNLTANIDGRLKGQGGDFKLAADLSGFWPTDANLTSPLTLEADLRLDDEGQQLKDLKINGEGLEVTAGLRHSPADGALAAQLVLALAKDSALVSEGLRLADLPPDYFSGQLNLSAKIDWRGPTEAASGRLEFQGRDLVWPTEELTGLLGSSLELAADLSGGGQQPFTAEINQARAGQISLSGRAAFRPAELMAHSELAADLRAALASLTPLNPEMAGGLELTLTGSGRLNDLRAQLVVDSPEISAAPGDLIHFNLKATAAGALLTDSEDQGPNLSGRLEMEVEDSPGGPLALTADWRFQQDARETIAALSGLTGHLAGLELAGALSADLGSEGGLLSGGLSAEVEDWSKLAALTGQPLSGSPAKIKIDLAALEGRQTAEAEIEIPALKLRQGRQETLSLRQISLAFKAADLFGRPDLDLDLSLGSGLAGPLGWSGGTVKAEGQGGRGSFSADLKQLKLAGAAGGPGGLNLAGDYDLAEAAPVVDLKNLKLFLGASGLTLKEPVRLSLGDNLKISPFSANFRPSGQLTAEVDLTPGAMKIKADLNKLPYGFFKTFAGVDLPAGEIQSLTVALDQTDGGLAGDFALKTQASPKELKNIKPVLRLNGRLTAGASPALDLEGTIDGGPGWKGDGKFSARLPLTAGTEGGFPEPNLNGPLQGQFKFNGPLAPLWSLAGLPDSSLSGLAQIEAEVGGTINKPLPKGTVYLAGGRYEDNMLGVVVRDITLEAHSTPEMPLKALLSAKDSRQGGLALEAQLRDLAKPSVSVKGRLSRFSPLNRDDILVFISGDLGAEGPLDRLNLSSDLTIERGEVDLKIIQAANSVTTLPISQAGDKIETSSGRMRFNLKVKLPGQFFIRGDGLESEWRGDLTIGGSDRRPSIVGQLAPVRGYFAFAAKEFQFGKGEIAFNGGTMPSLNLELINNGPEITAMIRATGPASKPKLSLESRPPLPEEEVLAHVLFGKNASSISRFEALQLASALNDLRNFGSGGFNAIGLARTKLGLDVLRLGGTDNDRTRRASEMAGSMGQEMSGAGSSADASQSDDMSVEAGKYLSDNIYVGVEHSGVTGAAVRLEVELAPSVSLEARTSTESSRVGLGWKKDY